LLTSPADACSLFSLGSAPAEDVPPPLEFLVVDLTAGEALL
jgi:hypothetical protein